MSNLILSLLQFISIPAAWLWIHPSLQVYKSTEQTAEWDLVNFNTTTALVSIIFLSVCNQWDCKDSNPRSTMYTVVRRNQALKELNTQWKAPGPLHHCRDCRPKLLQGKNTKNQCIHLISQDSSHLDSTINSSHIYCYFSHPLASSSKLLIQEGLLQITALRSPWFTLTYSIESTFILPHCHALTLSSQ